MQSMDMTLNTRTLWLLCDWPLDVPTLEAIRTLRSMRNLKRDPLDPQIVRVILEAAGKAPSGGNTQPWEFIVVTDPVVKEKLRDLVVEGLEIYANSNLLIPKDKVVGFLSSDNPVVRMAQNTDKVPVLILTCLNAKRARRFTDEWSVLEEQANWASVFPAVENLLLAARALGFGTAISIFPLFKMKELKQLFSLPEYAKPAILVYLGYPAAPFSEPKRLPIEDFIHENKW
jgi:nitroreductase